MKKLVTIMVVLAAASFANATLNLTIDSITAPSEKNVAPGGNLNLGVFGDGTTDPGTFYMAISTGGPGSFNISGVTFSYAGSDKSVAFESLGLDGFKDPMVNISLNDVPAPEVPKATLTGQLLNNLVFNCDGVGDLTVALLNGEGSVMSSILIHQVPEPITVALLGLGGLFIRRKRA